MEEATIKEIVNKYYAEGFHCAEAIANTIHEIYPEKLGYICKVTSGFCGGVGECKQDICGALSGGIIALGGIYGREKGGNDISKLVFLSLELRRLFIEEFTSTACNKVVENIKNKTEYNSCRDVTVKTTGLLLELIKTDLEKSNQ